MRSFKLGQFIATVLLLCLWSCAEVPVEKQSQAEEVNATFISNPIPVPEQVVAPLEIGANAPDFRLPGVDGRYHSLADYKDSKVLAVVFTCNHCPTAQAYEARLKAIVEDYADKSVQLIAISPNSPLGLLHEELGYSDLGDSFDDMKVRAQEHAFNFPYLYDGDNQKVSLQYGPAATPHCFVFDENRKLRYIGRIDAQEKPGTGQGEELRAAIDAILAGTTPEPAITKTFGCSTKWGWKTKMRNKIDKEWGEKAVTLEAISIDGLQEVMQNDGTKLRLINVWATWCGPCRLEYPEFVVLQRMFGARDFEFVSIAADKLSKREETLAFLKNMQSATTNYIVSNEDRYALIEAIDPDWPGAMPYTMLLEPGGKVVWRYQGEVDFHQLKRIIVDHPMIGRVY